MVVLTVTSELVVVAAAAGAVVIVVVVGLALTLHELRRQPTRADSDSAYLATAIRHAGEETERLRLAIADADEERRRTKLLASVVEPHELNAVMERSLEAATGLLGADAAALRVLVEGERPVVATLGLTTEEASPGFVTPPAGRGAIVQFDYVDPPPSGARFRGGVALILDGGSDEGVAHLVLLWRHPVTLEERSLQTLREVAQTCSLAIEKALRFHEMTRLTQMDALTGLANRRHFHDVLETEVARAQRYDRRLALMLFDLDDFKVLNDSAGHLAGDTALADVGRLLASLVRNVDLAARIGGDEFAVVLPESSASDGARLFDRLTTALAAQRAAADPIHVSAGAVDLAPEWDARALFEAADELLYRAKSLGKNRVEIGGGPAAPESTTVGLT